MLSRGQMLAQVLYVRRVYRQAVVVDELRGLLIYSELEGW